MNLTGMWALTQREVSRFLRVWTQTLIPPVVTSLLFIVIFGYSIGSKIDIDGFSYMNYIIPGLLMMGVIMSSYLNTSSSLYISKFQGNIQELMVAPLPYWQIIAALTMAAVLRGILVGINILIVAFIFADITIHSIWPLLFFTLMTSLLFAFAGIATALWATSFDKMNVFATFLITPLTYLGGVFYSIKMLPPFWQSVAKFNPILYMVDGFRYGFLGTSDMSLFYSGILVTILTLSFFLICVRMLKTGYRIRS